MIKTTKLAGHLTFEKEGIMYAATRTKQENLNADAIVVLSPKHPVTRLILRSLHEINHRGVQVHSSKIKTFLLDTTSKQSCQVDQEQMFQM